MTNYKILEAIITGRLAPVLRNKYGEDTPEQMVYNLYRSISDKLHNLRNGSPQKNVIGELLMSINKNQGSPFKDDSTQTMPDLSLMYCIPEEVRLGLTFLFKIFMCMKMNNDNKKEITLSSTDDVNEIIAKFHAAPRRSASRRIPLSLPLPASLRSTVLSSRRAAEIDVYFLFCWPQIFFPPQFTHVLHTTAHPPMSHPPDPQIPIPQIPKIPPPPPSLPTHQNNMNEIRFLISSYKLIYVCYRTNADKICQQLAAHLDPKIRSCFAFSWCYFV